MDEGFTQSLNPADEIPNQWKTCLICLRRTEDESFCVCNSCNQELIKNDSIFGNFRLKFHNSPWIIRNAHQILGPFSRKEVIEKLQTREFVALDEVSRPGTRWRLFREVEAFQEPLKRIGSNDDDSTTATASVTDRIVLRAEEAEKQVGKKTKVYSKSSGRKIGAYLFIAVGLLGGIFWARQAGFLNLNGAIGVKTDLQELAATQVRMGQFSQALETFRNIPQSDQLTEQSLLNWGKAALAENSPVEASRAFDRLSESSQASNFRAQILVGRGVIAFKDGQIDQAIDHFSSALTTTPDWSIPAMNLVHVHNFRGDVESVSSLVQELWKSSELSLGSTIYLATVGMTTGKGFAKYSEILGRLKRLLEQYPGYRQKLLFLSLIAIQKNGEVPSPEFVKEVLGADPFVDGEQLLDPFNLVEDASWIHLKELCDVYLGTLQDNVHLLCRLKAGETGAAQELNERLSGDSESVWLNNFMAWTKFLEGDLEKATGAALVAIQQDGKIVGPHVTYARICEERKDYACANEQWDRVTAMDPDALSAITGLVKQAIRMGNEFRGRSLVQEGLKRAPDHKPLLVFQEELRQ